MINRIANFNLIRGKLHVKFLINGNSFYYGRAIVSYLPLSGWDNMTLDRAFFEEDIIEASQRPHLYLDPTTNQGGTLNLPFVYPYNAFQIPYADWAQMGEISIRPIQLLKHANGGTDPVSISVFAWMSDVHLSVPTSQNPVSITPQSGDEYSRGPISTPAAVVADVAAKLSTVPVLKPYALATEMVASTASALAKSFGYARPVNVSDIMPTRPTFGNYANTNVTDNSQKLTLDIKQETTVDSRVCGLDGTDEMSIRSIATREAWITAFPWSVADTPETVIFSSLVTPIQHREIAGPPREYHLTPMAFATLPFKYWRGSMKFRFQVVSSGFHKGRLKVSWDPVLQPTTEFNVAYTEVVDVSTEKDFTITVGWGAKYPFLRYTPPEALLVTRANGSLSAFPTPEFYNGTISVQVVNSLTVPLTTTANDIQVNVFVSAGDDFEVAVPDPCSLDRYTWLRPPDAGAAAAITETETITEIEAQSGDEVGSGHAAPFGQSSELMGSTTDGTSNMYRVTIGDPIASVRQIVKRFCTHSLMAPTRLADYLSTYTRPDFPFYRGPTNNGINNLNTENYAAMTFINWFTPAYVCRRGGMRWKYHVWSMSNVPETFINVQRSCLTTAQETATAMDTTSDDFCIKVASLLPLRSGGTVNPIQQNIAEVELPYYTNKRFWAGKENNFTVGATQSDFHDVQTIQRMPGSNGAIAISAYVAAADDFSLSFFTGAPVLYVYN